MTRFGVWLSICLCLGLACSCNGTDDGSASAGSDRAAAPPAAADAGRSATAAPPGDPDGARTLPIPGGPPVDPSIPTPPPTGDGRGLAWTVPASWEEVPPASSLRKAQFRLPGTDGDGVLVVFYFGPGQGGDAVNNAVRWAGQFTQADGTDSRERMELSEYPAAPLKTMLVQLTGNYGGGMRDAPVEDAKLLAAIVEGPDANWFFKLVGPRSTVEHHEPGFRSFLESLRVDG